MNKKLGILMLDTTFERIPGDVGNPESYPFEIVKKTISGAKADKVVAGDTDALLPLFIEGAKELEREGVAAITTSCGFLAKYQKRISAAINVPFFSSSLLQINYIWGLLGHKGRIGVMAANSNGLTPKHIEGAGIEDVPIVVYGMEDYVFNDVFVTEKVQLNVDLIKNEVVNRAKALTRENPDVRAIVLECTVMPPYAKDIQDAVNLPVYDITTLANYVMSGQGRKYF